MNKLLATASLTSTLALSLAPFQPDGGTVTPIKGELDAFSVKLALPFEITGDVTGFEYLDVTVQETDGDVSVIDEQAELHVDTDSLRWRTTVETAATDLTFVRYTGTATTTDGDVKTVGESFNTVLSDVQEGESWSTTLLSTELQTVERSGGDHKLTSRQIVSCVEDDAPDSTVTLTDADGTEIATIEPTVRRSTSLFLDQGITFSSAQKGNTLSLDIEMRDADGEVLATETVSGEVRGPTGIQTDVFTGTSEV